MGGYQGEYLFVRRSMCISTGFRLRVGSKRSSIKRGKFLAAYKEEASADNEQNALKTRR